MKEGFGEQPPQGSDALGEMPDSERLAEYAGTGDPQYLTPALRERLHIENDIDEEDIDAELDAFYAPYGIDKASLQELKDRNDENTAYLDRLFEVASMTISATDRDQQDNDREVVERARVLLREYATTETEGVLDLVGMIRTKEAAGVRDVQVVEEIFDDLHREFVFLSHQYDLSEAQLARGKLLSEALNAFTHVSNRTLAQEYVDSDDNYLTHSYFENFCVKQKFTEPTTLDNDELPIAEQMALLERLANFDRDTLIPFEIVEGRLALYGVDKSVLYVADTEYSDEKRDVFDELHKQISYSVQGQYFARSVVADIPYDLEDEANSFMDASGQLGRDEYQELFADPEFLRDYLYLQKADMRETVERDFRVELKRLSITEQVYFLRYLEHTTIDKVQSMQHFTTTFGQNGMRSFLALNEDEALGDVIVEIGSKLDEDTAAQVFAKYAEITDAAESAREYARELLPDHATEDEETYVAEVAKRLRTKANNLLHDAHASLTNDTVPELIEKLETLKAENLLWAATFREFSRAGVPIEEFRDTSLEMLSSEEVANTTEDVQRMRALLRENYRHYENPRFESAVQGSFDEHLRDPHTHLYVLRHKDEVVGFNRFDEVYDEKTGGLDSLYLGSFNVERMQYGGNGIGNALLKASLEQESLKGVPIHAHCDPTAPISKKYIEWGFVATKIVDYEGVEAFGITLDPNTHYASKDLSTEEIATRTTGEEQEGVTVLRTEKGVPVDFSLLEHGQVLTRFYEENGVTVAVFERASTQS